MSENETLEYKITPDRHERISENRIEFLNQNNGIFDIDKYRIFLTKKYEAMPRYKNGRLKKIDSDNFIAILHELTRKTAWDVTDTELLRGLQETRKELLEKNLDVSVIDIAIEQTRQSLFEELAEKSELN